MTAEVIDVVGGMTGPLVSAATLHLNKVAGRPATKRGVSIEGMVLRDGGVIMPRVDTLSAQFPAKGIVVGHVGVNRGVMRAHSGAGGAASGVAAMDAVPLTLTNSGPPPTLLCI